ncbi:MAG: chromate transporter [Candidatus Caldatribacteriaceae bacterium]
MGDIARMITYWMLFLAFLRVGFFSFGGGLAALPLIEKEVVEGFSWLSQQEFLELVTLSELTPGPIAINSATFTGFKVGGMLGAVVATSAFCLPSFLLVMVVLRFLFYFQDSPLINKFLRGLRPAVLALLSSVAYSFVLRGVDDLFAIFLFGGGLLFLIRIKKLSPMILLLLAGFLGMFLYR